MIFGLLCDLLQTGLNRVLLTAILEHLTMERIFLDKLQEIKRQYNIQCAAKQTITVCMRKTDDRRYAKYESRF